MLTVYTRERCRSSLKAKRWLFENHILFVEKRIGIHELSIDEFKHILRLTDNGTKDIISERSQIYGQFGNRLEELPLSQLYNLVCQYSSLLRAPLVFNDRKLTVGFSEDELRTFISRKERKMMLYTQLN